MRLNLIHEVKKVGHMQISNSAQMLQLAQSLTQSHNGQLEFQNGLKQQISQNKPALQSQTAAQSAMQEGSNGTTSGLPGTQAAQASQSTQPLFNSLGNLNTASNLKDFGLLASEQTMLNQVNVLNQAIQNTQMAAMHPATFIQVSVVLKLFEQAELKYRQAQHLQSTLGSAHPEAQKAAAESQILLVAFFERCNKLFEEQKSIALSRFFKKGPLGKHMHEEDTDDEYGTVYNDVDAETDYIKRPRKFDPDMLFHYSLIS